MTSEPLRIAYIVGWFPTLSETFILDQIVGLIDRGHAVDIYADDPNGGGEIQLDVEKYDLLARTRYRPRLPRGYPARLRRAIRLAREHRTDRSFALRSLNFFKYGHFASSLRLFYAVQPFEEPRSYDIVHCHFGHWGNLGVLLRDIGALRGKVVTTFHGWDIRRGIRKGPRIYEPLIRHGDCFLAISPYNRENLEKLGIPGEKIMDHPVGVRVDRFAYKWDTNSVPGPGGLVRILTVARLVPEKGIEYGLRAIHALLTSQPDLRIAYSIVGAGPLEDELRNLARELSLERSVEFVGAQRHDAVADWMSRSHIFLLPSVAEALPVSLMEAQAAGLPVVATRVGSVDSIVSDGISGFLVEPRDPEALTERLGRLLEKPDRWPEMGRAGREHVVRHYDVNSLNDRLVDIFTRLLD